MKVKEAYHNKWVRLGFWALIYLLWVIWLGNWWFLVGEAVIFDIFITKKVNWTFWKPRAYKEGKKKSAVIEWIDAIVFAVIVVTFINIFFFQSFKIPSSSMESTLYTGDHLFVSKLSYGPRLPQTPLTIPFTHNTIGSKESYSTLIQCKYKRLKGFGKVERGDVVVFGFPNGDSVLVRAPMEDYYSACRLYGREYVTKEFGPVKVRPMDKKDHYVKRCMAVAGDTIKIIDTKVYVNSILQEEFPGQQTSYKVTTDGGKLSRKKLQSLGINAREQYFDSFLPGYPGMSMTKAQAEKIAGESHVKSVVPNNDTPPVDYPDSYLSIFPFVESTGWTRDNFGPLRIPSKGSTVTLTTKNLPFYQRIITSYEGHSLQVKDGDIYIDGVRSDSYTFGMDYYFMMGDNRHNSLDSRYWGFVPEDHIVGTPAIIWLSVDSDKNFPQNIRWRRFLKKLF